LKESDVIGVPPVKVSIALTIIVALFLLCSISASVVTSDAQQITTTIPIIDNALLHTTISIDARGFSKIEFYVYSGSTVKIIMYIYRQTLLGTVSDYIDVEIVRPDGSIEYVKTRVYESFKYIFTASMSGTYTLLLDNTFSDSTKYVDLAMAGFPPAKTTTIVVTSTTTRMYTTTTTIITTYTTTVWETYTTRIPTTITSTIISPTTLTSTIFLTETLTTTRTTTVTTPTTVMIPTTVTTAIPTTITTEKTLTTTQMMTTSYTTTRVETTTITTTTTSIAVSPTTITIAEKVLGLTETLGIVAAIIVALIVVILLLRRR